MPLVFREPVAELETRLEPVHVACRLEVQHEELLVFFIAVCEVVEVLEVEGSANQRHHHVIQTQFVLEGERHGVSRGPRGSKEIEPRLGA